MSDAGGVKINLRSAAEVKAAIEGMLNAPKIKGARIEGFLVEEMAPAGHELVIGGLLSVHEFAGRNWFLQENKRILSGEIVDCIDELGVLLAGHSRNAYWYGSQLSIHEARQLAPHNSATSLQVCVAVLSGMIWAIENPEAGVIEPDEMDFRRNLEICAPYFGPGVGAYTDWTPLYQRGHLFEEDLDTSDPWQFRNVLV